MIEGKNLDSVYRTIIRFNPNESHLKPLTRVPSSLITVELFQCICLYMCHQYSDDIVLVQECIGKSLATRMECITPVFQRDETEKGELSFDMDGALGLWNKEFSYHPYGEPIPFETEGHVLSLYPGFDEVSLHVG